MSDLEWVILGQTGRHVLYAGDFNAWASLWGCRSNNTRGELVQDLVSIGELRLANRGDSPTCVRPQGFSIIDLTWCTPGLLRRMQDWLVLEEEESYSDHNYLLYNIWKTPVVQGRILEDFEGPHWSLRSFDIETFHATLNLNLECSTDQRVIVHRRTMTQACDRTARRVRKSHTRKCAWWTTEVKTLHMECVRLRRRKTRLARTLGRLHVSGDGIWGRTCS